MKITLVAIIVSLFFSTIVLAQEDTTNSSNGSTGKYISLYREDDPLKLFENEPEQKEFKKKRPKRRVYYGHKSRKGFLREYRGNKEIIYVFHYLKKPADPTPYVPYLTYYNPLKQSIDEGSRRKYSRIKDEVILLHGPYLKRINGEIVEEGIYYLGSKHGRWEYYDLEKEYKFDKKYERYNEKGRRDDSVKTQRVEYRILKQKEYWNKGWPKESEITYYDREGTKAKEIIPIVNDQRHGYYFSYYKDGQIKEQGVYYHGRKEGTWRTYYHGGSRHFMKKEIIFPHHRNWDEFEPYVNREYDDEMNLLYEYEKGEEKRLYVEPQEEQAQLND